jgi:DNA-binding transcriptional MerR regulator
MKTRGSHRVYKRRDVELAMLIRRLLHDEGYTIPGARKRLKELRHEEIAEAPEAPPPAPRREAAREVALRGELIGLREQLYAMLSALDAAMNEPIAPEKSVTVKAVVPAAVPPVSRRLR